jgi:DNA-binding transcriptional ArsR family regulator
MTRQDFSDELLELIAARFKLLSEPLRLRLLNALRDGERTVTALVEETGATQANVSRHLALLHGHGMLARRKDGLRVYYGIADPVIFRLCDLVCDSLEEELQLELRTVTSGQNSDRSEGRPA